MEDVQVQLVWLMNEIYEGPLAVGTVRIDCLEIVLDLLMTQSLCAIALTNMVGRFL